MKRFLSSILVFVFVVGICASAPITITANAVSVDDLTFELSKDEDFYWLIDCNDYVESNEIIIPSVYNGLPVQITYGAFSYCGVSSIIILEGITTIPSYAFEECYNLTSIYIPKSITTFGVEAFYNTYVNNVFYGGSIEDWENIYFENELGEEYDGYSIENIGERIHYNVTDVSAHYNKTIIKPSTCTEIGKMSLSCSCGYSYTEEIEMLEHNYVGDSCNVCGRIAWDHDYGTLYNYLGTSKDVVIPESIDGEKIDTIYGNCFAGNENIETITISESISYLNFSALSGIPNLKEIKVSSESDYYKSVDGVLFDKNTEILLKYPENRPDATYDIPDGVKSISVDAFSGNDNLKSVNIPVSVRIIGERAFSGCKLLANIVISDEVQKIMDGAFYDTAYYNDVSNWENDVLYICTHLIEAKECLSGDYVIKSGTKSIAEFAFNGCETVESITIPNGVTNIGCSAFAWCSSIKSLEIPGSVKTIGERAFDWCTELETLIIGEGTLSIGYEALEHCTKLKTIVLPDSLTDISCSFHWTSYYNSENSELKDDILYINNHLIDVENILSGEYTIKNGTKCIADDAFNYSNVTSVTIPDGATSIGDSAFYGCDELTSISIPNTVTSIGTSAFSDCPLLVNVILPKCITSIEYATFKNCRSLTNVAIPNGITEIGEWAFLNCSLLSEIIIPTGVETIGNEAFYGTSLKSVTIPRSVSEIGYFALGYCRNSESHEAEKVDDFIIYGEKGTAAETYATENGFKFVEKVTHTHNYTESVTKQPTCTESGVNTFTCSCGDSYTETIAAKGHTEVTVTGKAATCTATGLTDGKKCSVCNTVTKAQETIKAKGHTTSVINKKDATCTVDGYTGDTYCSTCKTTTEKGTVIKATGHKEVVIPAVAPTYTTVGKTEGKKCSVCGTITVAQKDVAKLTLATPVVTVKNSATGVKVTWKAIDGATSYKVYRKTYSTKTKKWGSWKTCGTVTTTSYVDTKAKSGTKYIYTVKALNSDVKSGIKSSSNILYLAQPTVKIANASTGVKVSWNKITGANGYKVYRAEYANGKWTGWKSVKTIDKGSTVSWTDTKAKSGVKYKYTVKAVNGKTASTYKSSSSLLYLTQPKVTVKAVSNGIKVAWVQSTGATSYKIYRSEYNAKTKKWSSWKSLKTAKSTSKSYTDKTAKKGVKYRYTVKAVNGKVSSTYKASSSVKR